MAQARDDCSRCYWSGRSRHLLGCGRCRLCPVAAFQSAISLYIRRICCYKIKGSTKLLRTKPIHITMKKTDSVCKLIENRISASQHIGMLLQFKSGNVPCIGLMRKYQRNNSGACAKIHDPAVLFLFPGRFRRISGQKHGVRSVAKLFGTLKQTQCPEADFIKTQIHRSFHRESRGGTPPLHAAIR